MCLLIRYHDHNKTLNRKGKQLAQSFKDAQAELAALKDTMEATEKGKWEKGRGCEVKRGPVWGKLCSNTIICLMRRIFKK